MKETTGNIWDFHKQGHWIVITTNGTVKTNGEAVMGKGIALQAKQRFPKLPILLGSKLKSIYGNVVHFFPEYRIVTLPVKYDWRWKADPQLIEKGVKSLIRFSELKWDYSEAVSYPIYMVRPGCGNGQLDWRDVKLILEKYLDDRFVVVERRKNGI